VFSDANALSAAIVIGTQRPVKTALGLVVSGQIKLRRIDGGPTIATVLSQRTATT
jgi:hypothetical protein